MEPTVCVDDVVNDARTGIELNQNVSETGSYRLSHDIIAAESLGDDDSNPSSGSLLQSHAFQILSACTLA